MVRRRCPGRQKKRIGRGKMPDFICEKPRVAANVVMMPEFFDQEAALDEIARGNVDAFRAIVRAHSLSLRSFITSQVYDLDQVDDLCQEVFIAAYRSLH